VLDAAGEGEEVTITLYRDVQAGLDDSGGDILVNNKVWLPCTHIYTLFLSHTHTFLLSASLSLSLIHTHLHTHVLRWAQSTKPPSPSPLTTNQTSTHSTCALIGEGAGYWGPATSSRGGTDQCCLCVCVYVRVCMCVYACASTREGATYWVV
jgi:hypothetical protein